MMSWTRTGLLACCLALSLAACGGSSDDDPGNRSSPATTSATAAPADSADFCSQLADVKGDLALINISLTTDWSKFEEAAKQVAAVEPPAKIAAPWQTTTEFYAHIAGLFKGVDFSDRSAVGAVLDRELGPELETRAKATEKAIATIQAYADDSCSAAGDAEPAAVTDACTLLAADDLNRVFPAGVPKPDSREYGPDSMECIWKTDNAEASIMIVPIALFETDYLGKSTPRPSGKIDGLEGGDTFKGVLGVGRFNTRGHSVSFTTSTVGGFVSVRHGGSDSRAAQVGTAAALAKVLVGKL